MMFIWWLMKRAWKPVVDEWNRPAIDDDISGKARFYEWGLLGIWVIVLILTARFGIIDKNPMWVIMALGALVLFYAVMFIPDRHRYLSKLYDQYRIEQPAPEKRKRKRKRSEPDEMTGLERDADAIRGDWQSVGDLMGEYFEPEKRNGSG